MPRCAELAPMSGIFPYVRTSRVAIMAIIDPDDAETIAKLREILGDGALLQLPLDAVASRAAPVLTERQDAILGLLGDNLSNKEIGRALAISHFTVRNHVSQLLRIFEVATRKALIAASANGYRESSGRYRPSMAPAFASHPANA
jgi:DNA-binding CsgD family transcriptional regulator